MKELEYRKGFLDHYFPVASTEISKNIGNYFKASQLPSKLLSLARETRLLIQEKICKTKRLVVENKFKKLLKSFYLSKLL